MRPWHTFARLVLFAVSVFNSGKVLAVPVDWMFDMKSLNYSEPVYIKDNFDDWETEHFSPGNRIYTKQLVRSGLTVDNSYGVGISAHYYYYLNFSKDTSRWHYLNKNDRLEDNKQPFTIDLHANHSQARGIYFSKFFTWKEFSIHGRFTYLDLQDITLGSAEGRYDPAISAGNSSRVRVDYAYTEEKILDRVVAPQSGWGLISDVYLAWRNQRYRVNIALEEIYSLLRWDSVSASTLDGDLSNLDSGSEAVLVVEEFYSDIRQRLPSHSQVKVDYVYNEKWALGLGYENLDTQDWYSLRAIWSPHPVWDVELYLVPDQSVLGFDIKNKYFNFQFAADDTEFDKSHYFRLGVGFNLRF